MVTAAAATKEPTNSTEAKAAAAKEREAAKATKAAEKAAAQAERERIAQEKRDAKANAPKRHCLCQCGAEVNGKSNFLPGHDARLAGAVARGERDAALLEGYPLLQAKAAKMKAGLDTKAQAKTAAAATKAERDAAKAKTDAEKAAKREADRAAKAETKAAETAAKAAAKVAGTGDADIEVKVGTEWFPGHTLQAANDKGDVGVKYKKDGKWVETVVKAGKVRAIQL